MKKNISLHSKTEYIMDRLLKIFIKGQDINIGAFFITYDGKKQPFIAFNKNIKGVGEIDISNLENLFSEKKETNYIKLFIDGCENKTIIELQRNANNKWIDLYSISDSDEIQNLHADFLPEKYNRLFLIRLSKKISIGTKAKAQGVIGFYFNDESKDITSISILRYILLLRTSLSKFIEVHHENDEFRDWQIASIKQKTSLLTGHGREMLIKIASNRGEKYKEIVSTILMVQRFLIDKKEEDSTINSKSNVISEMFKNYYQKDSEVIKKDFFDSLHKIAKEIFEFEEIENTEQIEPQELNIQDKLSFRFNKRLLNMVCFEILVNAKKNRWIFLDGEKIIFEDENYSKNKVWIEAEIDNNQFIIKISNTGPKLLDEDMNKIKSRKNIKPYDNSSGIELINTLLEEFNLGEIGFEQKPTTGEFTKFTVTLTLNKNNNE